MSYCINQNHCGNTNFKWEEYITEIPHQNYVSGVVVHYTTYLQIEEIYHIKNEHVEEVPIIYNIPHVMGAYDDFVENHGYDTYEEYAEFTPIF